MALLPWTTLMTLSIHFLSVQKINSCLPVFSGFTAFPDQSRFLLWVCQCPNCCTALSVKMLCMLLPDCVRFCLENGYVLTERVAIFQIDIQAHCFTCVSTRYCFWYDSSSTILPGLWLLPYIIVSSLPVYKSCLFYL